MWEVSETDTKFGIARKAEVELTRDGKPEIAAGSQCVGT